MVTIKQDVPLDKQKAGNLFNKLSSSQFTFNTQLIKDDLARLNKLLTGDISDIRKNNIELTTSYLKRLLAKAEKGDIKLSWVYHDNKLSSHPIEMASIKNLSVESVDYITIKQGKMVYVDYIKMCNLIAYEIMYKDYGDSFSTLENKLSNLGIITVYPYTTLENIVPNDVYDMSKVMKVEESPYLMHGDSGMCTYFGAEVRDKTYYRDVVDISCREAILIILTSLLLKLQDLSIKFNLCGLSDSGFYLLLDCSDEYNIEHLVKENVIVRAFGRKFEVEPSVQIY